MRVLDLVSAASWMSDYAGVIAANADLLTDLDRQIGDADHGANMDRGMRAVAALDPAGFADAAGYLKKAGMTLVSTVGGASGPLYGTFLLRFAGALPPEGDAVGVGAALRAGYEGILARGKAEPGDKTMVDSLAPALAAYDAAVGGGLGQALAAAARAGAAGRDATVAMVARKGRASYLGERSVGVADPGATSVTMLLESAAKAMG